MVNANLPQTNVVSVGTGKPDNGAIAVYVYGAVDAAALATMAGVISVTRLDPKCLKLRMEERWFTYHVGLLRDSVSGNLPAPRVDDVARLSKRTISASVPPVAMVTPVATVSSASEAYSASTGVVANDIAPIISQLCLPSPDSAFVSPYLRLYRTLFPALPDAAHTLPAPKAAARAVPDGAFGTDEYVREVLEREAAA